MSDDPREPISKEEDSKNEKPNKRERTTSESEAGASHFDLMTGSSPPRFVLLQEAMKAANSLNNMALTHEIALNENFKLGQNIPENSVEKYIHDIMHETYWKLIREKLSSTPPDYTMVLKLLGEVKQNLFDLLLPQHKRLRQEITEVLDEDVIKQQAEQGFLDFQKYADYVLGVMSKLCAPVRDDAIKELSTKTDEIEIFRGIMETLHQMKLDMANFTMKVLRPEIIAHSVEIERKNFAQFLNACPDGLTMTKEWLKRNITEENKNSPKDILNAAYMELLSPSNSNPIPESLVADRLRLPALREQVYQLTLASSVILVALANVGSNLRDLAEFKQKLKDHVTMLINDFTIDGKEKLDEGLHSIGLLVVKESNSLLEKHGFQPLPQNVQDSLISQIRQVAHEDHKIRSLVWKRIGNFLLTIISSEGSVRLQIPAGLSTFQSEFKSLADKFLKLVSYNRAVFAEYYEQILAELTTH